MTEDRPELLPWYKSPWPWVAIAIPGAAVIMGITTLVLALNNPDPLVVDDGDYKDLRSGLKAQQVDEAPQAGERTADSNDDGEG